MAGTVCPEFGFVVVSFHSADDFIASFGWISSNGEIVFARKIDIPSYVEHDATSNRSGHVHIELTNREVIELECTSVAKGEVSLHHDVCCMDVMCKFSHSGKQGFCDFETISNNPHGKHKPRKFTNAGIEDGFHAA
jgi:hypothetical protein